MRIPKYRRHSTGVGFVEYRKKRHYFPGKYGSPESVAAYSRFVEELTKAAPAQVRPSAQPLTIAHALERYLQIARTWKNRKGDPDPKRYHVERMAAFMLEAHGTTPLAKFGPRALRDVRAAMEKASKIRRRKRLIEGKRVEVIEATGERMTRGYINEQVARIRRFVSWAVGEEIIPAAVADALEHVPALRAKDTDAPNRKPVKPAPELDVEAAIAVTCPVVGAMIVLHRFSGMRPDELCAMKREEIDTSSAVWEYRPLRHKNEGQGFDRLVYLGPRCQAALAPLMDRPADAFMFSPRESVHWHGAQRRKSAKYVQPNRSARKTSRRVGDHYSPGSYRRAVAYATTKAKAQHWFPYQLRHSRGTEVRKRFKLEGAQVSLGHARADVTQLYAERDQELARSIAAEIG